MERANYKIGYKEYIAMTMIIIGIAVSDDTPSIVYQSMKNTGWMQPLISGLFTCIPLFFLIKMNLHFDSLDFAEIILHVLGNFFGKFSLLIIWIALVIKIIIESAVYTNILDTMFLTKTPPVIIFMVLMIVAGYIAYKGIVYIASISWILLIFVNIAFILSLSIALTYGDINFLFPLFGSGELLIIKESFFKTSMYIDFLFLAFLLPHFKQKKDFSKASWIVLILIAVETTFAFATYILLFDYNSVILLNYPYQEILRYIQVGFLTNMESFFFPFWLIAVFIRFSVYLYISILLFEKIFHVKESYHLLPCFITLFIMIGLIAETPPFTLFKAKTHMLYIYSFLFIAFPILLWVVTLSKGELSHDHKNS